MAVGPRRLCSLRPALAFVAALVPVLAGCSADSTAATGSCLGAHPAGNRAGLPRYYVVLVHNPRHPQPGQFPGDVVEVHQTATGRLTDVFPLTVRLHTPAYDLDSGELGPGEGQFSYGSGQLAAAADQRTFFVSHPEGVPELDSSKVGTGIDRFRLTGSGRITGFTEVARGDMVARGGTYASEGLPLAASPDGCKLAMTDAAAGPAAIAVVDLATRRRTVWQGDLPGGYSPTGYSWEADDRTLALMASAAPQAADTPPEMRTLDTRGGGGSLAQSRHVVTLSLPDTIGDIEGTIVSPDGRTITAAAVYFPNSHPESNPPTPLPNEIVEFSAATGAPAKVLDSERGPATPLSGNEFGGQIASDGNGHLLHGGTVDNGPSGTAWELDWVGGGRLHGLIFGGSQSSLTDFAW